MIALLGRERSLERIDRALETLAEGRAGSPDEGPEATSRESAGPSE
ncbi:MAG: hypothetical protein M8865_12255 [marine benthic group bacterium]|nr:hypothetical protein [Gemmatimonadota bacterium]